MFNRPSKRLMIYKDRDGLNWTSTAWIGYHCKLQFNSSILTVNSPDIYLTFKQKIYPNNEDLFFDLGFHNLKVKERE